MLDFRYHALSLVAVFLALAIGIVLGVTIGDSLLSDAERSLRSNLRADVTEARSAERDARGDATARDRLIAQLYPEKVDGRLGNVRVGIVSWGSLPEEIESAVRKSVEDAGGKLDFVARFRSPLTELKTVLGTDRWSVLGRDRDGLEVLGDRLAGSLVRGGNLAQDLHEQSGDQFAGSFRKADAVVFYEAPAGGEDDEAAAGQRQGDRGRILEGALLKVLREDTIATVGVERSRENPSQVSFYRRNDLSSVDSVDTVGGRLALIFALGGAEGTFGFKDTAEAPLPDEAVNSPTPP